MPLELKQALTSNILLARLVAKKLVFLDPKYPIVFFSYGETAFTVRVEEKNGRYLFIREMSDDYFKAMEVKILIYWGYNATPESFFSRGCKDQTELLSALEDWWHKRGNFS